MTSLMMKMKMSFFVWPTKGVKKTAKELEGAQSRSTSDPF